MSAFLAPHVSPQATAALDFFLSLDPEAAVRLCDAIKTYHSGSSASASVKQPVFASPARQECAGGVCPPAPKKQVAKPRVRTASPSGTVRSLLQELSREEPQGYAGLARAQGPAQVCGDFGGLTRQRTPCQIPVKGAHRCHFHKACCGSEDEEPTTCGENGGVTLKGTPCKIGVRGSQLCRHHQDQGYAGLAGHYAHAQEPSDMQERKYYHSEPSTPASRPRRAPVHAHADEPTTCGENGGVTKAGTPCKLRVRGSNLCHHHA